jgi:hypothetical protein
LIEWGESTLFAVLLGLYLIPVWAFPYLPTQDGPHHLANAVLLKDYGSPGARYRDFFQLQRDPIPNWTTHLLLISLLHVLPPLAAEKVLASLYIVGFAYSVRYFLGAVGPEARRLAPIGLLFLFNRCFLMGFYNYCLSLVAYWLIVGYCLRRRERLTASGALGLFGLFALAYFTHLLGYALAVGSALWVAATAPTRRPAGLGWVAAAALPTGMLAIGTLTRPGLLGMREAAGADRGLMDAWRDGLSEQVWYALRYVNDGLFSAYAGPFPMGLLVLILMQFLLIGSVVAPPRHAEPVHFSSSSRPAVGLLGTAIGLLYLVVPDSFSLAVGFLKARLVILPPLLWVACFRPPAAPWPRRVFFGAAYLLVGLNLFLVGRHFSQANRDLAEYTAMVGRVGEGRTLFVAQTSPGPQVVNHLEHAADLYCLTGGNLNLDNFQATVAHFPVRFRPGVRRGYGSFAAYPHQAAVDLLLVWNAGPDRPAAPADGFRELYHGGRLTIFERVPGGGDRP